MSASSQHTGWYRDWTNSRLDIYYNGTRIGAVDANGLLAVSGLLGYNTGAGGTVTQATSKTTGVTLNAQSGQITMNNASLGAGAEVVFTVTNSFVSATDVIIVNVGSGATTNDDYVVGVGAVGAGSFDIYVGNVSAGALTDALVLNFAVISGASS